MQELIFDYETDRYWEYVNSIYGILFLLFSLFLLRHMEQGIRFFGLLKGSENIGAVYSFFPVLLTFVASFVVFAIPIGIYLNHRAWDEDTKKQACIERKKVQSFTEIYENKKDTSTIIYESEGQRFKLKGFPGPRYFIAKKKIGSGNPVRFSDCRGIILKIWD